MQFHSESVAFTLKTNSTNFIPVKTFETGDGLFFQWVLCTAIWSVGLIVQLVVGATEFQPWAVLGGVSWATGNK